MRSQNQRRPGTSNGNQPRKTDRNIGNEEGCKGKSRGGIREHPSLGWKGRAWSVLPIPPPGQRGVGKDSCSEVTELVAVKSQAPSFPGKETESHSEGDRASRSTPIPEASLCSPAQPGVVWAGNPFPVTHPQTSERVPPPCQPGPSNPATCPRRQDSSHNPLGHPQAEHSDRCLSPA